jgi:hypothetical protein
VAKRTMLLSLKDHAFELCIVLSLLSSFSLQVFLVFVVGCSGLSSFSKACWLSFTITVSLMVGTQ